MVILPDANILIYAYDEKSDVHDAAKFWLQDVMTRDQVILTWQTITAFIRITTSQIGDLTLSIDEAVDIVTSWLDRDNVKIISFDKDNWSLFAATLKSGQAKGNLAMDAHLAALGLSCGATLATRDRDFSRFDGLKVVNPLPPKN